MFAAGIIPPLLAKELIELAATRRTYVLRTLFALVMFGLFVAGFSRQFLAMSRGDIEVFGQGRLLFDSMVYWQFAGIYLFLPIMVAPAIPLEEERGNLELLLVSGIRPAELLIQKLASRLLAMAGFLMLALPIAGLAYTLGGVSLAHIGTAVVCLGYACLQVGCLALWFSARERSPMRALLASLLGVAVLLGIVLPVMLSVLLLVVGVVHHFFDFVSDNGLHRLFMDNGGIYSASSSPVFLFAGLFNRGQGRSPFEAALLGLPCLGSAGLCLWFALRALRRRGTVMSKAMQEQMAIYRPERRYELHRRRRVVALGQDGGDLPDQRPLAWRELRRGKRLLRGWLLLLGGIGGCTAIAILIGRFSWVGHQHSGDFLEDSGGLNFALAVTAPLVAMLASGVISGERAHSSLPLLLVSPLPIAGLLAEKLGLVDRLCWLTLAMIGGCAAVWLLAWLPGSLGPQAAAPLIFAATAWLYLRLAAWLGLAFSLRIREPVAAAVAVLATIAAWVGLPLIVAGSAATLGLVADGDQEWWEALRLLSPATALRILDEAATSGRGWWLLAISTLFHSGLLAALRWWTLRRADALLGRVA